MGHRNNRGTSKQPWDIETTVRQRWDIETTVGWPWDIETLVWTSMIGTDRINPLEISSLWSRPLNLHLAKHQRRGNIPIQVKTSIRSHLECFPMKHYGVGHQTILLTWQNLSSRIDFGWYDFGNMSEPTDSILNLARSTNWVGKHLMEQLLNPKDLSKPTSKYIRIWWR